MERDDSRVSAGHFSSDWLLKSSLVCFVVYLCRTVIKGRHGACRQQEENAALFDGLRIGAARKAAGQENIKAHLSKPGQAGYKPLMQVRLI